MVSRAENAGFFVGWAWTAVLAGVFTSLVVQILLTMLGFGVGPLSIDVASAGEAPRTAGYLAFVWWAVSGIIAAFFGGAVAAANSPDQTDSGRVCCSLAAWMVAIVVVVGASAVTAGSAASVASNLVGPSYSAATRIENMRMPARAQAGEVVARATPAEIEAARRHFAYTMLASFAALLLGGFAAYGAGMATTPQVSRRVVEATT
jgi:hypothetical protein